MTTQDVAVIVPIYRNYLTSEEQLSLLSLQSHLAGFPTFYVCPAGLEFSLPYTRVEFPSKYFESIDGYNRLMLTKEFYSCFLSFKYILIYQLDCLIFSSNLKAFYTLGYDYIGSPWVNSSNGIPTGLAGVGNGGLSLRNTNAFLQVLESGKKFMRPLEYWEKIGSQKHWWALPHAVIGILSKFLSYRNNVRWFINQFLNNHQGRWYPNEDLFWSRWAVRFSPSFRIAPENVALRFSFEKFPRFCFEMNDEKLPFGCHGWNRYDPEFWRSYLTGDN